MRCCVAGLGLFLFSSSVVFAQPPPAVESRISVGGQRDGSRTLDALLPEVEWNTAERGPLLAVVPKDLQSPLFSRPRGRNGERRSAPPPFPEKGANGYRLNPLAEYFGYRAAPVGTLTVVAPAQMTVLNTRLPKPDVYAQFNTDEKIQYFQSTLTPQQWRKFGSVEGIGIADLNPKQREIFLSLLPEPMRITQRTLTNDPSERGRSERITLTPEQRAGVRLNLSRAMDWSFRMGANGTASIGVGGPPRASGVHTQVDNNGFAPEEGMFFGAMIREEVPARQKPGHLPFDWNGLDAPISLENATKVGELIQRVREATRVDLYADLRYAEYPVFVRGASARSGDVLRALALAVTGTYRKVGSAYLLTDDIIGLGTRHAMIGAWLRSAAIQADNIKAEVETAINKANVADYVTWATDDPMAPNESIRARIEAHRKEYSGKRHPPGSRADFDSRNLLIPVSEMSADAQAIIKRQIDSWRNPEPVFANAPPRPEIQTDKVILHVRYQMRYVIPGLGPVNYVSNISTGQNGLFPELSDLEGGTETANTPAPVTLGNGTRILTIAPKNPDEALKLVEAAKRSGFNALWVQAGWEDTALIAATVKAGKRVGIPVGAVVRVLRTGGKTNLPADINILGETSAAYAKRRLAEPHAVRETNISPEPDNNTRIEFETMAQRGDWLRPDSPQVIAALLRHLKAISEIPDLASLALSDLAPPGYRFRYDDMVVRIRDEGWQMGYSEEMRLAFLREKSVDPVDISPFRFGQLPRISFTSFMRSDVNLPLFPDYGMAGNGIGGRQTINGSPSYNLGAKDSGEKWLDFRLQARRQLIRTLVQQLQSNAPNLPLYGLTGETYLFASYPSGYALLTSPEQAADSLANRPAPDAPPGPFGSPEAIKQNTKEALQFVGYIPFPGADRKSEFPNQVRGKLTDGNKAWNGFVLDLTTVSAADALILLEMIQRPESPKP